MSFELITKMLLMFFLSVFTVQDIRKRGIDILSIMIFYIFIIFIYCYKLALGGMINFTDTVLGILSGVLLLPAAKLDILGEGDAFVFIGSGAILGVRDNIILFLLSVFIVSLYALIMGVYCMVKRRRFKGMTVAMLPFVTAANCILWIFNV